MRTDFGFESIDQVDKKKRVNEVFDSVSSKYDLMNDVMSFGLHRLWKAFTFYTAKIKPGDKVLDIAGGTGDMTTGFKKLVGSVGEVWHTDINFSMLKEGKSRLVDKGIITPKCICNAEELPFINNYFDVACVAFGLRNMTYKDKALNEMYRVLKPGGMILVLEFSKIYKPFTKIYDFYTLKILPLIGRAIANDYNSYKYLAESIKMHPNQDNIKTMMENSSFTNVSYHNLALGICALHRGYKI